MSDFQNQIVSIVGRKGSGKSTKAGTLLKYAPRILVWDPMADHFDLLPDSYDTICVELDEYFEEARTKQMFACNLRPRRQPGTRFRRDLRAGLCLRPHALRHRRSAAYLPRQFHAANIRADCPHRPPSRH